MQSIYCVIVKCFIVNSLLQVRLSTIKQLKCLKNSKKNSTGPSKPFEAITSACVAGKQITKRKSEREKANPTLTQGEVKAVNS